MLATEVFFSSKGIRSDFTASSDRNSPSASEQGLSFIQKFGSTLNFFGSVRLASGYLFKFKKAFRILEPWASLSG
jgi:hypothetical protein